MNFEEFRDSLAGECPPKELSLPLAALWWDAKGDWTKAHESAQQDEGPAGEWVHAYLHRKKGTCRMLDIGTSGQESFQPACRSIPSGLKSSTCCWVNTTTHDEKRNLNNRTTWRDITRSFADHILAVTRLSRKGMQRNTTRFGSRQCLRYCRSRHKVLGLGEQKTNLPDCDGRRKKTRVGNHRRHSGRAASQDHGRSA